MNKPFKLIKKEFIVSLIILLISSMILFYSSIDVNSYKNNSQEIAINNITTGQKILIDEAHLPVFGVSNTSVAAENKTGYSTFADLLIAEGYTIDTLDSGNEINFTVLEDYDLLITCAPQGTYTSEEISTIYNWTTQGNTFLLISEWGPYANSSNFIADAFNYELKSDILYDLNDNQGNVYWMNLNESNIKSHVMNTGILGIEMYGADGIISDPIGAIDIIATDLDDTTNWNSGDFANNIPVISARENWGGSTGNKIVIVTDSNIWANDDTDFDGIWNILEHNNSHLAINIVNWLSPIVITETSPLQGVYFSFIAVFVILISFIRVKRRKH